MSKRLLDYNELMLEWDYEKNDELGLDPSNIYVDSKEKAWWKCSFGHEYMISVSKRINGIGCKSCAMRKTKSKGNELSFKKPDLAAEWHPTKNGSLLPSDVSAGSGLIVWWICEKGHEWKAQISSRVRGSGCPYCANKLVKKGYNDFGTKYPELVKEWHPSKNNDLTPYDFTFGSGKKVWWMCNSGHEYQAALNARARGTGCPICANARRTSFPEQAIFYYIKRLFPDSISRYKDIFDNGREIDVYIPSIKTGIEYDGLAYHNYDSLQKDNEKYEVCKKHGIRLIRVVETSPSAELRRQDVKFDIPNGKRIYLDSAIESICSYLNKSIDIDTKRDRMAIMQYLVKRDKSLASEFPDIALEWDYELNAPQKPEHFDPYSNEKVGWICKNCGNKWETSIASRTGRYGTGCPICARKSTRNKLIENRINRNGSLYDSYPQLMEEWDFETNTINPKEVSPGSRDKVKWICKKCGYKWIGAIDKRTTRGHGCPLCSNQVIVPGINDLLTKDPILASELDVEKNGFGPESIAPFTNRKVWWKCNTCGNSWQATPNNRSKNHGCPFCSGRVPRPGINDFKTLFPELALAWDYEKNGELRPEQFLPHSHKRVWWKCPECNYEWQCTIRNRTIMNGCANCKRIDKRIEKNKPLDGQIEFEF